MKEIIKKLGIISLLILVVYLIIAKLSLEKKVVILEAEVTSKTNQIEMLNNANRIANLTNESLKKQLESTNTSIYDYKINTENEFQIVLDAINEKYNQITPDSTEQNIVSSKISEDSLKYIYNVVSGGSH